MSLQVHQPEGRPFVVLDEKLWLTADRDELVPDGDERAAFLFGTPGKRVDLDEAKRLGLVKAAKPEPQPVAEEEPVPEPQPEPAKKPAAKAAKKPADKAVKAAPNKGG